MNTIIIHGAYGYPSENWFGWLKSELNTLSHPCSIPRMPTPIGQTLEGWFHWFNQQSGHMMQPTSILVGHSLGAIFLLRYLLNFNVKVHACILVGAFHRRVGVSKFDLINQEFLSGWIDWSRLKTLCEEFYCYHSTNDPYVTANEFNDISTALNANRVIISQAGHFNTTSGYTSFPHLLRHIVRIITRNTHN